MDNDILILDSTTISLSHTLWSWARGKRYRGAIKIHTLLDLRGNILIFIHVTDGKYQDVNALYKIEIISGAIYVMDKAYVDFIRLYTLNEVDAFFVVRAKENFQVKVTKSKKVNKSKGLRCDQIIKLVVYNSKKQYPAKWQRIKYNDSENDITLVFLTNNFEVEALEVAALYKNHWPVELFFKWIKQNLQIKIIWGHS
jgi:IS4 transposase